MALLDMVVVGHFSIDYVERDDKAFPPSIGGTVTFSSLAAARLGAKVGIVSKVGPDFRDDHLLIFARNGIDVSNVRKVGTPTTKYRLRYQGEERTLTCLSRCEPIEPKDIRKLRDETNAVHLGPIAAEIPLETVDEAAKWGSITLLDLQGVIRKFGRDGCVSLGKNRYLPQIIEKVTAVKTGLREGEVATHATGAEKVASALVDMGCKIAIITFGGKGSYVSTRDGDRLSIPVIKPRKVTDYTGAGDVYAGSFLFEYSKTHDVRHSAIIASSAVSFKVEGHSTSGFASRQEIEERAKEYL
nr:PfkB family carbohydrate kinase [Candidatus Njordarchaeum guaymaensis]